MKKPFDEQFTKEWLNWSLKEDNTPFLKSTNGINLLRRMSYSAVVIVLLLIIAFIFVPTIYSWWHESDFPACDHSNAYIRDEYCKLSLVESIPFNLTFNSTIKHLSTFNTWSELILNATKSIEIASFYWTLRGADIYNDSSDWQGEAIYNNFQDVLQLKKVKLTIVQNQPNKANPDYDTIDLKNSGASVSSIDFEKMLGSGILHTKLLIFDKTSFYVGSANMDWRSLTQVKELGIVARNCPILTGDIRKIFKVYKYLGEYNSVLPSWWPLAWHTCYNIKNPMRLTINDLPTDIYLASSPAPLNPMGRANDVDAILNVISTARKFINIAVMDYEPSIIYSRPSTFWPVIDDALRRAALDRKVHVRLMVSWWRHTKLEMLFYLKSLVALTGAKIHTDITVKLFCVPSFSVNQSKIPFARVNHNKYMVTETTAYIGTSNWSGDYFTSTGGIGLVINQTSSFDDKPTIQDQLTDIFMRDWMSAYVIPLRDIHKGYTCDKI